ncbi:D-2-hydroxyacid dehydrogenase family protein [Actinomadura logoneensis]|uniref:D-2-hydroxyacid dehydrogenase family protein n=1 Tax=Actinomadura logoneensis TaxID=2293572 RepID=A0A372JDV9_9ACTN|nr:D-2-hydroxyacid dehydrogenase family protein [Actinomadura logoneensis]RFU38177.1 D-2-hydroxyacid dehydrogenase family protein [Actinomadura logoneensis]
MKIKCAVIDDFQGVAESLADWSRVGSRVDVRFLRGHEPNPERLAERIGDCGIVVAMRERTPFREELLARLPNLRLLVTSGMRNASIDLDAAARQGVTVCGTPSASHPTAELTWALLLGLARHVVPENAALRTGGPWQQTIGTDLHGRRLGVIGLGKIGSRVARVGAAFGMDVVAWSPALTDERAAEAGARRLPALDDLLETSDFVTVHVKGGERTRGLLGADELRRMRPSAYLINTSRASVVDQDALADALREGRIAGAGVDVYDIEPLPEHHEYRTLPNLLATPHLGYVTQDNYRGYFAGALEDIEAFLAGEPVRVLN